MDRLLQFVLSNAAAAMALAFVAAAASRWIRRAPLTRALWVLVLLKLLTPPIWTLPISLPSARMPAPLAGERSALPLPEVPDDEVTTIADQPADPDTPLDPVPDVEIAANSSDPVTASPAPSAALPKGTQRNVPWLAVLLALYLAGVFTVSMLILRSTLRVRRLVANSVIAPLQIRRRALELSHLMGLSQCPQILLARGPVPPMLCATGFHARIILPASLWSRLSPDQQDTVLVHELAHLRHGDHWIRRLELLAAVLYWWHPAVWWSRPQLREAGEQCCDAWVLWALPRLARSYAEALVETVDFISLSPPALPALASGMGQFTDLRKRLVMIHQASAPRSLTRPGYAALCSLAGLLLPLAPTFAQEAVPVPPVPPEAPQPPANVIRVAPEVNFTPALPSPEAPHVDFFIAPNPEAQEQDPRASDRARADEDRARAQADRGRAEIDRARAQVDRARDQLREAERRLNEVQRNVAQAERDRARAMAERQKEMAKEQARAAVERSRQERDRARDGRDQQGGNLQLQNQFQYKNDFQFQNKNDNTDGSPRPRANFQVRVQPPRAQEYVQAGARLKAAGDGAPNADLERRLDRLEKQLDEMVNQLRQMRQQASKPGAKSAPREE